MDITPNIDDYIKSPLPIQKELKYFFKDKENLIIFDIGSCEAEDSIRYSLLFPSATIHSFEPVPDNIKKGIRNIEKWNRNNILLNDFALADKVGEAELHLSEGHPDNLTRNNHWDYGNKSSSLLKPHLIKKTHKWINFTNILKIKTKTLDEYSYQNQIKQIDFIHIDVQGAELIVLSGAKKMIYKTGMIWLEVENIELYKDQPVKNQVEHFMKECGFTKIKDTVNDISGDQLYINAKYLNISRWKLYLYKLSNNRKMNIITKIKKLLTHSSYDALQQCEWQDNPLTPPHAYKQKVINEYQKQYNYRILVETGTFLGDTVTSQLNFLYRIISVELGADLYRKTVERFKKYLQVTIIQGESDKVLNDVMESP